ncbi:MAG TPA: acyltransferase [Caulobacteraceae bacterium]
MRAADHHNNFGALRLFFAALVVLSHAPWLVDGDLHREPLTRAFGTITFGDLAVDGFFLVSGYLVTQSWQSTADPLAYLWRRILRIYPGFVVASLVSLFIVGPLVGGDLSRLGAGGFATLAARMLVLQGPKLPGAFAALPVPHLNGSLWTIGFEFRCYLLVMLVGAIGLFRRRRLIAAAAGALLAASLVGPLAGLPPPVALVVGWLQVTVRFTALFAAGATFFLFRDLVVYSARLAFAAGAGLIAALFTPLAEIGVALFGGYLIFWAALHLKSRWLARINARADLSYGLYLYAWPLTNGLVLLFPGMSPWLIFAFTLAAGLGLAWVSWRLVEKPALNLKDAVPWRSVRMVVAR